MAKLTKKRAKALSLEVWRYLRDHPECKFKCDIPAKTYKKVEEMHHECPLCDIFNHGKCFGFGKDESNGCPLFPVAKHGCANGLFFKWENATTVKSREIHASAIVKLIEAWEV